MRCILFVALLAACGDSGDPVLLDGPPMADASYDTSRCLIQGFYGALGAKGPRMSESIEFHFEMDRGRSTSTATA